MSVAIRATRTASFAALLFASLCATASAQNAAVTISVDAGANRRAIDPRIYGTAYASTAQLSDLNFTMNRYGGNNSSRYNWQQNADNRANDWYFESIGDDSSVAGERGDTFISGTRSAGVGAQPMITIPMVGYVAKLGANRAKLASFSIAKYGSQTGNDWQWYPDAGNGILTNGSNVTGNNPLDANIVADSTYQQSWVQHLVTTFGTAANGGLKYYIYDNEPSIWHSTHRDVHPIGATMTEIKNKIIDYGTKIRAVDPGAILVGPEEWGWSGYFYDGFDQQYAPNHNWTFPDYNAAGMYYLPWLLDQLHKYDVANGKRLLDIFTVHWYPQSGEFNNDPNSDDTTSLQLLRNRSTRSLWDPTYVDQSWIGSAGPDNGIVQLIPRLRNWVNTYYPGTKIGITEYNWGDEDHINGATTQADILGIFGREGLDIATRWTTPDTSTPTYKAMKMYRNYNGSKSTFGDTSVKATVPNPDNVSAFAATRSIDGWLTVMVISKYLTGTTPMTLNLTNFNTGTTAQVYQLTSSNAITRLADTSVTSGTITATLPAQSITLFVIPKGTGVPIAFNSTAFAMPNPVTHNTQTKITATVKCTSAPATHILVDVEVYNAAGAQVFQKFVDGQSFATTQTRNYVNNWTPTVAGTYTVKIGVFKSGWSPMYTWNNSAATITVN